MEPSHPSSGTASGSASSGKDTARSPARFMVACAWRYRFKGLTIVALGFLASLAQVIYISMSKPMLDILSGADSARMVAGFRQWLSPEQESYLRALIDRHLLASPIHGLFIIAGGFLTAAVLYCPLNFLHHYKARILSCKFQLHLFESLYGHILRLPVDELQRRKQGDLLGRFSNDLRLMQETFCDIFQVLLRDPFSILITLVACFLINWQVTLFAVGTFGIVGFVITVQSRRIRSYSLREIKLLGSLMHMIGETIHGITVVKIFQSENLLKKKIVSGCRECLQFLRKLITIEAATASSVEFLAHASIILVILWQGSKVLGGLCTFGDLFAVIFLLTNGYKPIRSISLASQKFSRSLAGAERYLEIFNLEQETGGGSLAFPKPAGSLELRNLSFGYEGGSEVLRGISARIEEGQTVAIVGPTGSGKTTLLHLLPLFHQFPEGMILLNGKSLQQYSLFELRANMALVSQNVFLFNDSIGRNICFGIDRSHSEIETASRAAHAHEFIEKLPEGYDTLVGDRGILLSGGQRQRIALARAILKNPAILLLDEATSALDSETERLVQQAISSLSRGRTTIVVAHRLSTVQNADMIFVLSDGRFVESGRHEELLKAGGAYAQLYSGFSDDRHGK